MINLETRIQEMFANIHEEIREDITLAAVWARDTLAEREGRGHIIQVSDAYQMEGFVVCSFAKPEWSGDHCGAPMPDGSQAIVRAVCEYLCGA